MSATEVILTIFWDGSDVLYTKFPTKGLTVNSDKYCAITITQATYPQNQTFPKLNEMLKDQCFSTDAEAQAVVGKWTRSQPESFSIDGMKKWIE
ncbi:hypothetical protein TNCV_173381 [Trichonephila clavipes]|nr:hypothetical protein TNCV_173381 [Trichonephila clavipes]